MLQLERGAEIHEIEVNASALCFRGTSCKGDTYNSFVGRGVLHAIVQLAQDTTLIEQATHIQSSITANILFYLASVWKILNLCWQCIELSEGPYHNDCGCARQGPLT